MNNKTLKRLRGKKYYWNKEKKCFTDKPPEADNKNKCCSVIIFHEYYNNSAGRTFSSMAQEKSWAKENNKECLN